METTNKIRQFEVAEIQLSYKSKVKPSQRPKITSSKDAYEILLENWDMNKLEFVEQFKIILLNRANRIIGIYETSTGGVSGTVADPKLIFAAAIKSLASAIILSHYVKLYINPTTIPQGSLSQVMQISISQRM